MAHFRIEVEHVILATNSTPHVKFDMAYTHQAKIDSMNSGDPVWFLVDSMIREHAEVCANVQAESVPELEKSLKRQLEPCIVAVAKKPKKSVRFEASVAPLVPEPCLPLIATCPIILGNAISIDFCDFLRRRFSGPLQANTCVILEDTADCKQIVYPSRQEANSGKGISLRQLIKSTNGPNGVGTRLLLHERVSLAKMLAVAVLQYHSTPWLRLSCCSEDILFFDLNTDVHMRRRLPAPYINARIRGQSTQTPAKHGSTMARNPILFSLGVMFLELAHVATLNTFTKSCDAENGLIHQDFFTARRLAKIKRTDMGATYNDIVEQLVEGAFPYGADLNHLGMQASFYEKVICPLEELEQGLRKLCLGNEQGDQLVL